MKVFAYTLASATCCSPDPGALCGFNSSSPATMLFNTTVQGSDPSIGALAYVNHIISAQGASANVVVNVVTPGR